MRLSSRVFGKLLQGGNRAQTINLKKTDFNTSGTSGSFGLPAESDDKKQPMDLESLDNFALERWEVCYSLPRGRILFDNL
jgi:hypothetical protein